MKLRCHVFYVIFCDLKSEGLRDIFKIIKFILIVLDIWDAKWRVF